jgi:transposase
LNLRGMARRKKGYRFGRSVADAGFARFLQLLGRQGIKRDSLVVPAPRLYPSSKTCLGCAAAKTKPSLSERVYSCSVCGLVLDRDVNAARNLAAHAARTLGLAQTQYPQDDGVSDAGEASSHKRQRETRPQFHPPAGARPRP